MNARTVVLAFLAGRAPAAYTEDTIRQRITNSGLLDNPPISVGSELAHLASERMGGLVDMQVNKVSKEQYWFATDAGVKAWAMEGRLHVG